MLRGRDRNVRPPPRRVPGHDARQGWPAQDRRRCEAPRRPWRTHPAETACRRALRSLERELAAGPASNRRAGSHRPEAERRTPAPATEIAQRCGASVTSRNYIATTRRRVLQEGDWNKRSDSGGERLMRNFFLLLVSLVLTGAGY